MISLTVMVNRFTPNYLNDWVKMCSVDRGALGNFPVRGASSAIGIDSIGFDDREAGIAGHVIGLAFTGRISRSDRRDGTQHPGRGKSSLSVTPLEPSLEKFGLLESSKELSLGDTWGEPGVAGARELTSCLRGPFTRGTQDGNTTARANQFGQLGI